MSLNFAVHFLYTAQASAACGCLINADVVQDMLVLVMSEAAAGSHARLQSEPWMSTAVTPTNTSWDMSHDIKNLATRLESGLLERITGAQHWCPALARVGSRF